MGFGGLVKKLQHRSGKAYDFHIQVHSLAPCPVSTRRMAVVWNRGDKVRMHAAGCSAWWLNADTRSFLDFQHKGSIKAAAPGSDDSKGSKPGTTTKYVWEETFVVPATLYQVLESLRGTRNEILRAPCDLARFPRSGREQERQVRVRGEANHP